VDASSDRELRYGRVTIVESTNTRVHVRWSTQPCDLNYKVWGESVVEDFWFYPDGFGIRAMTLVTDPGAQYELEEDLFITPPAAYPLRVFPENLTDVLFYDGSKHELKFPILDQERDYEKLLSGKMPPLYRYRMSRDEMLTAIYFNPDWTRMPVLALRPFYSQGQLVTPFYWGNHLPLTRRKPTGIGIDYHADRTPAHNSTMGWGHRRPTPLENRLVDTVDALGISRQMQVQQWAWLIGMSDAPDGRLLEWAHSYANPPDLEVTGGRFISHVPQSRASRIEIKAPKVIIGIKPSEPCVNPVFELINAPKTLLDVKLKGRLLKRDNYAWDGQTLWINADIGEATTLELRFADQQ
jgi:hypothetical protein